MHHLVFGINFHIHSVSLTILVSIQKKAGTERRLKRDKVVKIARLTSCKNFVTDREKFIFDTFVDL